MVYVEPYMYMYTLCLCVTYSQVLTGILASTSPLTAFLSRCVEVSVCQHVQFNSLTLLTPSMRLV